MLSGFPVCAILLFLGGAADRPAVHTLQPFLLFGFFLFFWTFMTLTLQVAEGEMFNNRAGLSCDLRRTENKQSTGFLFDVEKGDLNALGCGEQKLF